MYLNVLIVDEMGTARGELKEMLRKINVNIIPANDEIEALNKLHDYKSSINAIIWTVNSIELKEFDSIKKVKSKESYKHFPVVIISRLTEKRYIIKAIECGAIEYIIRPFDENLVLKKLSRVLCMSSEASVNKREEDVITFTLSEMVNREIKAATRGIYSLSLTMVSVIPGGRMPVDENEINNIINLINKAIKQKLRDTDTTFRYSTGNLIIILPFAHFEGANIVERKLNEIFESLPMLKHSYIDCSIVTASVTCPQDGRTKEQLFEKLDRNFGRKIKAKDAS